MSMRTYGIVEKGLIISPYNVIDLFKTFDESKCNDEVTDEYKELIRDSIADDRVSDFELFQEFMQDILYLDMFGDFSGQYNSLYKNISPKGNILRNDEDFFEEDTLFIYYLEKDLLFDKYENLEEIYDEIRNHFKVYGFMLDDEFLKKNVGEIEGTIYG